MADPLTELISAGTCLGSSFVGGVVCNLVSSQVQTAADRTLLSLRRLFSPNGARLENHDLHRALIRAQSRAVIAVCDGVLLERGTAASPAANWAEKLAFLSPVLAVKQSGDAELNLLWQLRTRCQSTYEWAAMATKEELEQHDVTCPSAVPDIASPREEAADWLRRDATRAMLDVLKRSASGDLPTDFIQAHSDQWFDYFRLGLREEIKENPAAQAAYLIDFLDHLATEAGQTREQLQQVLDRQSATDQKIEQMRRTLDRLSSQVRRLTQAMEEKDLAPLQKDHSEWQRLQGELRQHWQEQAKRLDAIKADTSYTRKHGATKEDLERLKAELLKPAPPPQATRYALPAKPYCIHRGGELKQLTQALTAPGSPVAVLGPPGVGKSTLTLAALHQPEVIARYRAHRAWVRCDAVSSEELLRQAIAQAIGLTAKAEWSDLRAALTAQDSLVALDNFETPWRADSTAVAERLADLNTWPGVQWLLGIRGAEAPVEADRQTTVPPFTDPSSARELFRHHALGLQASDADLDSLLSQMDGLPLAIVLLACQAKLTGDLPLLKKRWEAERSALLCSGTASSRLTSLDVSLRLSTAALPPDALPLLRLLGILPAGLAPVDLEALLCTEGYHHAATLASHGLLYTDARRLRQLAPIREHVAREHPPGAEERKPWDEHYLNLVATLAKKAGRSGGAEAISRLLPDATNIEHLLIRLLEMHPSDANEHVITATRDWSELVSISGRGTVLPIIMAAAKAAQDGKAGLHAECTLQLGQIACIRSDHTEASRRFQEALTLFQRTGSIIGEAHCIFGCGNIALAHSDYSEARRRYEEAMALYSRAGVILGQANCIHSLGNIAIGLNELIEAEDLCKKALPLYLKIDCVIGQANCIRSLGDIALESNDIIKSEHLFHEALPLYGQIGGILGQANCIRRLGDIALKRANYSDADQMYHKALRLYQQVGDALGQANCFLSLGNMHLHTGDHAKATQMLEEGLTLFQQINYTFGQANCHFAFGCIALERREHVKAEGSYHQAMKLYRNINDVRSEANCVFRIACIAQEKGDTIKASNLWLSALARYEQIGERFSQGVVHRRLAKHAQTESVCHEHLAAARRCWASIDRPDLITELNEEFGSEE